LLSMSSHTQMSQNVAPLAEELNQRLGADRVLTAPEDVAVYGYDGTAALRQNPACGGFPLETSGVASCVQAAHRPRPPSRTRGSGTGLSGGSVPMEGSLVVCLNRMHRIIELHPRNLTIEVEAGAITQTIDEAAAQHGLFYPPD